MVALCQFAAHHLQGIDLRRGLDAFGQHPHVEAASHRHHGLHDGAVVGVAGQALDEGAVDLDAIDRQALEVAERGEAGAEVVQREADAHLADAVQGGDGGFGVLEDVGFGDFELDPLGATVFVFEDGAQRGQKIEAAQLPAGDVDGHRRRVEAGAPPGDDLATALAQHQFADAHDQAIALGQRDEFVRRHHAELGVRPAAQGLEAGERAGGEVELGLQPGLEAGFVHRVTQRVLQPHAVAGGFGLLFGVALDVVAALTLGLVHGGVGVADQGLGVVAVLREDADPEAGADEEFLMIDGQRRGQAGEDALGRAGGELLVVDVFDQDHEFIAAEAGDGVLLAHAVEQARGDLLEHRVAHRVTKGVVDVLEVVEVEKHHRHHVVVPAGAAQGGVDAVVEQAAVGQAGERVVVRHVLELRFGVLGGGDVGENAQVVRNLALLVPNRRDVEPLGIDFPRFAPVPDLALPHSLVVHGLPHAVVEGRRLASGAQDRRLLPDHLGRGVAGDAGEGRVDHLDGGVGAGDDDPLGSVLEHLRGELQPVADLMLGGHLAGDPDHADGRTVGLQDRRLDGVEHLLRAVFQIEFFGAAHDRGLTGDLLVAGAKIVGQIGREQFMVKLADDLVDRLLEKFCQRAIDDQVATLHVLVEHDVRGGVEQGGQQRAVVFGLAQRTPAPAQDAGQAAHRGREQQERHQAGGDPAGRAVILRRSGGGGGHGNSAAGHRRGDQPSTGDVAQGSGGRMSGGGHGSRWGAGIVISASGSGRAGLPAQASGSRLLSASVCMA